MLPKVLCPNLVDANPLCPNPLCPNLGAPPEAVDDDVPKAGGAIGAPAPANAVAFPSTVIGLELLNAPEPNELVLPPNAPNPEEGLKLGVELPAADRPPA